jgi:hypothetical protein
MGRGEVLQTLRGRSPSAAALTRTPPRVSVSCEQKSSKPEAMSAVGERWKSHFVAERTLHESRAGEGSTRSFRLFGLPR